MEYDASTLWCYYVNQKVKHNLVVLTTSTQNKACSPTMLTTSDHKETWDPPPLSIHQAITTMG